MGQPRVQILADSCCDMGEELLSQRGIGVLPLYVLLGEDSYRDGVDITPRMLYDYVDKTQMTPKTAAANVADFIAFFTPYLEEGCDILYIGIGSKISSSVSAATAAVEQLGVQGRVRIIDSQSLSSAIALLLLTASDMAMAGATLTQIADKVQGMVALVRTSFVLDQLEYLYRGGRCSAMANYAASILRIHPQILMVDGALTPSTKYRGNFVRVVHQYTEELLLSEPDNIDPARAFVTYTEGSDEEVIETVYAAAKQANIFNEILLSRAGCVITSHCGRNTIGLLYLKRA